MTVWLLCVATVLAWGGADVAGRAGRRPTRFRWLAAATLLAIAATLRAATA